MQTLTALQSGEKGPFLILLPAGVPDRDQSVPLDFVETRERKAEDRALHQFPWTAAINSMRWHVGPIYMDHVSNKFFWEQRAVGLLRHLRDSKTVKERNEILHQFLNDESSHKKHQAALQTLLKDLKACMALPEKEAYGKLSQLTFQCHLIKYDFEKAVWNPKEPETLEDILKTKGPILVLATLGPTFYEEPPHEEAITLCRKKFWTWPKGSKKRENVEAKPIILVGICIREKVTPVLFVVPNELTDPPAERKLYGISYEKLEAIVPIDDTFGYTSSSLQIKI